MTESQRLLRRNSGDNKSPQRRGNLTCVEQTTLPEQSKSPLSRTSSSLSAGSQDHDQYDDEVGRINDLKSQDCGKLKL